MRAALLSGALLLLLTTAAVAVETEALGPSTAPADADKPTVHYRTEGDFFVGYRWLKEDSPRAAKCLYPHSSATFGVNLISCPLPYRYHLHSEFLSSHDFYMDAGFAYGDLVLFRDILVGVHHNLEHIDYGYPGEPGVLGYTERNPGADYDTDFFSNLLTLRLKAPDFPMHAFVSQRHVEREGTIQQRFLLGHFDDLDLVSQSRDIHWKSNALTLGANSHAGPLEIEYAYDQARFLPGPNAVLHDPYPAAATRPADIYPHNAMAKTESSGHTIKLHSAYTGGIVTGATLSSLNQKNTSSTTESTTWKGAFDFRWIPDPHIGLFFKYRHRTLDMDTPDTATLAGLANSLTYPVRPGISSNENVLSLSSRYRPSSLLTILAGYTFSQLNRKDVEAWQVLPEVSRINTVTLTAHARPTRKVKVKADYEYKEYDNPSYNSTPDSSHILRLTTSWTPTHRLNFYLQYLLAETRRDSLVYLNNDPAVAVEGGDRDGRRDQFLVSLNTALTSRLSLAISWYYQRWDVEQDLAYARWLGVGVGDLPYIDQGVPYTDEANSFGLSLSYLPRPDISISAAATYTLTEGKTGYGELVGGSTFALESFSPLKAAETSLTLTLAKKIDRDWEVALRTYLDLYNDRIDDGLDGEAITATLSIKRYF
jgi:hypothetical protein